MNGLKVLLCLLVCVLLTTAFEADVGSETYNVGSRTAKRGQFPYIVSLRTLKNRQHFCNGFILSEHWVGTAAQCISRETNIPSNVFVLAGAHTLTDGKWYNVSRIAVHPRYNARFLAFNVALVRTISKIKFHNRVQPVRFPKGPRIPENSPALIAGWGSNANRRHRGPRLSPVLQWLPTRTISREDCLRRMRSHGIAAGWVRPETLCTINGKGACSIGAGGPLILPIPGVVVGIVSWGFSCTHGSLPGGSEKFWTAIPFLRSVTHNSIRNLPRGLQ